MNPKIRNINKDWKNAFPKLKSIGTNRLFEIVGPLLIGIELVKSKFGDNYKPYLIISSLFGSDIATNRGDNTLRSCLNSPDLYYPLIRLSVDYDNSSHEMTEIVEEVRKKHLPLEQNISAIELIDFIDFHKTHYSIVSGSSGAQAYLLELKYLISVYLNNETLKRKVIKEIDSDNKLWNPEHFEMWIGDYNVWLDKLKKIERCKLNDSMNYILSDPKLKNINRFKLINT